MLIKNSNLFKTNFYKKINFKKIIIAFYLLYNLNLFAENTTFNNVVNTNKKLEYFSVKSEEEKNKNNDQALGKNSIAIGPNAKTNSDAEASISLGYESINNGNKSIVLGSNAKNSNILSTVVGYKAENSGDFGTIVGVQSINSGLNGTVIGANSKNSADDAIVLGSNSENSAYKGIIIGNTLNNSADLGLILGNNSKNTQQRSIVVGTENSNTGLRGIVIGEKAINNGTLGIVLGQKSNNLGQFGVVIGHNSSNNSEGGVAIGETIKNSAPHSAVIGDFSNNASKFSNVFGYNSHNSGESGLVLGSNANNKLHSAVALGSYSQTTRSRFSNPYNIFSNSKETIIFSFNEANIIKLKSFLEKNSPSKLNKFNKIITDYDEKIKKAESDDKKLALMTKRREEVNSIFSAWKSNLGSLAIGNEKTNQTRQITGLAAGTEDTDAVNIAQLKSLKQYVDDNNPFEYRDSKGNSLIKIGNNYYKKDGTKISDENIKNGIVIATKEGKIINNVKNPIDNNKAINTNASSNTTLNSNVVTEDSFKGEIISNTLQITNGENKILGDSDTKLKIELKNNSIENKHIKDRSISENKLDDDLRRKIVLSDLSKKEIYDKISKNSAVNTAMANLHPLSYNPLKPSQIMTALGINGKSVAIAIGLSHHFNENSMFNASASMSTFNKNNEFALGLGLTYRLGSRKEKIQNQEKSIYTIQKEIKKLIEENKEKDKKIKELENKIEKILNKLN